MGLSAPRADSFVIIALQPVKKLIEMNPMSLSAPWDDYLDTIFLRPVRKKLRDEPNAT